MRDAGAPPTPPSNGSVTGSSGGGGGLSAGAIAGIVIGCMAAFLLLLALAAWLLGLMRSKPRDAEGEPSGSTGEMKQLGVHNVLQFLPRESGEAVAPLTPCVIAEEVWL